MILYIKVIFMNKTIFDFEELNDWHETNDFLDTSGRSEKVWLKNSKIY